MAETHPLARPLHRFRKRALRLHHQEFGIVFDQQDGALGARSQPRNREHQVQRAPQQFILGKVREGQSQQRVEHTFGGRFLFEAPLDFLHLLELLNHQFRGDIAGTARHPNLLGEKILFRQRRLD
jgi:hypothetical protein